MITPSLILQSIASLGFKRKSFIPLSTTTSFHVFLGLPLCLAPSTFFSPNHRHPFLKRVHTIAIYFFVLGLICLLFILFLTAASILRKIVYPLISHHISIYCCLTFLVFQPQKQGKVTF